MSEVRGAETFRVPAQAYDRYIGRYGAGLARSLCDFAAVGRGPVLDVGCGPGALTGELVRRLGDPGAVAAVDPSEPFAQACRERCPGVRVEVGPAERLPFGDATCTAALAQLVVNFMTDARAGVAEMRRVVRPGGTVAAAVWDYGEGMTLLRAFWDEAVALDPSAAGQDEARMPWCTREDLASLWTSVGLEDVTTAALEVHATYDGFDDLWAPLEHGVGPAGAHVVSLDDRARAGLRAGLRRRLSAGDGPFELAARAWAVRGTVPAGS